MKGNKIAEARKAKGLSQAELASMLNVSQQALSTYERGINDLSTSMLIEISKTLDVTMAYLLGMTDTETSEKRDAFVEVPVYGAIAAGTPIEMLTIDKTESVPVAVSDKYPEAFLLKVEGESMNKVLPNGCYALIDPCNTVDYQNKPYAVCVNSYDATIKRVRKLENGFELIPDSVDPTYHSQVYDRSVEGTDTITVIGRVVWHCIPADWEY